MRARELKYFKKHLQVKRQKLVNVVQKTENYGREVDADAEAMDIGDRASSSYTKEFMFTKSDSDRQLLQEVVDALIRIDDGTYGECGNCGEVVDSKRLKAVPWTFLCLQCQEEVEREMK